MAVRTLQRRMPGIGYATAFRADSHPTSHPTGPTRAMDAAAATTSTARSSMSATSSHPFGPPRFDGR